MALFPIPYQTPAPVVFGPFSPDNMSEYANIQGFTWNAQPTINNNYMYGVPFTLQSSLLATKVWISFPPLVASGTSLTQFSYFLYIFAIYTDDGRLMAQTLLYGADGGGLGIPASTSPNGTGSTLNNLIPFTSATMLNPGNYYFTFAIATSGTISIWGASTTTPIQTNVALGIKEADITLTGTNYTATFPSTVTWRVPTQTQCCLIQMQGIGVSI